MDLNGFHVRAMQRGPFAQHAGQRFSGGRELSPLGLLAGTARGRLATFLAIPPAIERGPADHVVQTNAAQRLSAFMFNGRQYRKYDFNDQFRLGLFVGLVCCSGTKNVFYGDAVTLPCKLIPAPWTADPLQDAIAHQ